jgi:hypothetical protein
MHTRPEQQARRIGYQTKGCSKGCRRPSPALDGKRYGTRPLTAKQANSSAGLEFGASIFPVTIHGGNRLPSWWSMVEIRRWELAHSAFCDFRDLGGDLFRLNYSATLSGWNCGDRGAFQTFILGRRGMFLELTNSAPSLSTATRVQRYGLLQPALAVSVLSPYRFANKFK